jgi:3-methyladenine DNA glycosylase AlkC
MLKDQLFNAQKIGKLAQEISAVYVDFKADLFQKEVLSRFPELELKARIAWISACLKAYLPDPYQQALAIILKALPPACDPTLTDDDFGEFIYAPYSHFVAEYGCSLEHLEISLSAIERITTRFSAEYAIRTFILHFPDHTLKYLKKWIQHPHYHVRRLVSEGTRPKLPWAQKIPYSSDVYLPLLDSLYKDSTRFVTRSVANHLNDVSKIDPSAVLDRLSQWKRQDLQSAKELDFITKHSLRTLIKQGHIPTLTHLGLSPSAKITTTLQVHTPAFKIGEKLTFTVDIHSHEACTLIVDYILMFRRKDQKLSPKVFKLKTTHLKAGEPLKITKTHPFPATLSTRTFYPGTHAIKLQINGRIFDEHFFELKEPT